MCDGLHHVVSSFLCPKEWRTPDVIRADNCNSLSGDVVYFIKLARNNSSMCLDIINQTNKYWIQRNIYFPRTYSIPADFISYQIFTFFQGKYTYMYRMWMQMNCMHLSDARRVINGIHFPLRSHCCSILYPKEWQMKTSPYAVQYCCLRWKVISFTRWHTWHVWFDVLIPLANLAVILVWICKTLSRWFLLGWVHTWNYIHWSHRIEVINSMFALM